MDDLKTRRIPRGDYLPEDAVLSRVDETLSVQLRRYGTTRSSTIGGCRVLKVTSTAPADAAESATSASARPLPWTAAGSSSCAGPQAGQEPRLSG